MTLPSIYYFLYYAAVACLMPFLALFYQAQGMTGSQIGVLSAISPVISFLGAPLWTGTADVTHRHKAAAILAGLGTVTVVMIMPGIASFVGLIVAISLYAFFVSPIGPLADSAVMALLDERKDQYGRVRLWGTLGYGVAAPIAGVLVGKLGLQWSFWCYAILIMLGLFVIVQIPFRQSRSLGSFFGGMRTLFANQAWMLFLVMVFIGGVGMATVNNYLFLYMESLGASKTLMGLSLTVSTMSEIPAMFFGNRFLRRFGARGLLIIAMAAISLRLLLYSITTVPWVVLVIQLIHGLTFAAIFLAGVSYADQIAPAGMKATTQGMFSGTLMGFGSATGGLLGGILMDRFDPSGMYAIVGGIVFAGLIAFLLVERRLLAKSRQGKEEGSSETV